MPPSTNTSLPVMYDAPTLVTLGLLTFLRRIGVAGYLHSNYYESAVKRLRGIRAFGGAECNQLELTPRRLFTDCRGDTTHLQITQCGVIRAPVTYEPC